VKEDPAERGRWRSRILVTNFTGAAPFSLVRLTPALRHRFEVDRGVGAGFADGRYLNFSLDMRHDTDERITLTDSTALRVAADVVLGFDGIGGHFRPPVPMRPGGRIQFDVDVPALGPSRVTIALHGREALPANQRDSIKRAGKHPYPRRMGIDFGSIAANARLTRVTPELGEDAEVRRIWLLADRPSTMQGTIGFDQGEPLTTQEGLMTAILPTSSGNPADPNQQILTEWGKLPAPIPLPKGRRMVFSLFNDTGAGASTFNAIGLEIVEWRAKRN
jgi:hypothetical protein